MTRTMASNHVRKFAAIAFTDIVGFSKMAGKDEVLALELLDEHQEIVRPCITRFGGREVKTIGDAFMVEFGDPKPAVEWAVAVQEALHQRNQTSAPDRIVNIRIGIHAGDVVQRGDDLFGDGVNIAARVEPQAPPGGVAVSGAVHDPVAGKVPMAFEPMANRALKNIDRQIALYRVLLPWEDGKLAATAAAKAALAVFAEPAPAAVPESDEPSQLRVALLPLANASGDPLDVFIPEAIQEDLLGALTSVPDLKVIGHASVARFRKAGEDVTAAARELRAGLVLTGSAGIAAGRLRLSIACRDAIHGEVLWEQEFSAGLDEASGIYAAIVTRVAETVGVEFPEANRRRVVRRLPASPLGVLSHLRGWYQLSLGSVDALQRAQGYFKAGLQQDARHALSQVGMAESFTAIGLSGKTPPSQLMMYIVPGASEAALTALQQDPLLPEAHAARGKILTAYTFDFTGAEQHLRRTLRGGEGPSTSHVWLALTLAALGRSEEAQEQIAHALDRDPLSATVRCAEAFIHYCGGRQQEASRAAAKAVELDPSAWHARLLEGLAKGALGDTAGAETALKAAVERSERHPVAVAALGHILGLAGRRDAAAALLDEMNDASRSRYVPAIALAILQLAAGRAGDALTSLERAAEEQNWLAFLHRTQMFDGIRPDARFTALLEDSGVLESAAA